MEDNSSWPDIGDDESLSERHTLVLKPSTKAKLMRLKKTHRKDVNRKIREIIEKEADAELQRLGDAS